MLHTWTFYLDRQKQTSARGDSFRLADMEQDKSIFRTLLVFAEIGLLYDFYIIVLGNNLGNVKFDMEINGF